jgi:hypothetical protein
MGIMRRLSDKETGETEWTDKQEERLMSRPRAILRGRETHRTHLHAVGDRQAEKSADVIPHLEK